MSRLALAVVVTGITLVMLSSDASPDRAEAAFPGANGLLAYVETQSSQTAGIYTNNDAGTDPQRLTTTFAHTPDWSPDGQMLLWTESIDSIFIGGADASNPQFVATGRAPAWHPDGERIVYYKNDNDIYIANPPVETNLTNTAGIDERNPVVSPDGTKIAYVRSPFNAPPVEIWVMNIDGTDPHNITNAASGEFFNHPDWSPDGTKIAFTQFIDGGPNDSSEDIWIMDADGTNRQNLTNTPNRLDDHPAWSPDGQRIAFHRNRMDSNIATPQGDPPGDTWTMATDGTDQRNVSQGTGTTSYDDPSWQPVPIEVPDLIWGDTNCDGVPAVADAFILIYDDAGVGGDPLGGTCPALGEPVETMHFGQQTWGDWDCSGVPDAGDILPLLAYLASALPQPPIGCPFIGSHTDGTDPIEGGVLAGFLAGSEMFALWTNNPDTIQQLFDIESGASPQMFPIGPLLLGPGPGQHNHPFSWHFDPAEVTLTEAAIEVCDATPSYVQQNPDQFFDVGYCPWSAVLFSLTDFR